MSKNLTRKGLAFGAIVALGASLFSAAPAFAADELTLVPSTGTLYNVVAGETFKLTTGLAPATNAGNIVQLKYQVVTDAAKGTVTPVIKSGTLWYGAAVGGSVTNTIASIASTPAGSTNTTVYAPAAAVGSANTVELTSTVTGTTAGSTNTAKVTAFFDANANGKLDSGEYASAERTITWVLPTDVKTSVTISKVTVGDDKLTATATLTDINTTQITIANYGFLFRNNDGTKSAVTDLVAPAVVATVKTDGSITASTAAFANSTKVVEGKSYRADVVWKSGAGWATTADTDVIGTGATIDAVKRSIASIAATASGTVGVSEGSATTATSAGAGALAVSASNVKGTSVKVVATVKDSASTPAVVANAAFKVTVTGTATANLSSTNSYSINGTAYTTAPSAALEATSDASGQVTFTVANATAITAGQTVILTMVSENITNVVTITYSAPVYTIYDNSDVAGSAGRTVLKAGTVALSVKVLDQFGDAPVVAASTSVFRVVDVVTGTNTGTYYGTVAADGTASISQTAAAAGTDTHTLKVQKSTDAFANTTNLYSNTTGPVDASLVTTVVVKATAAEVTAGSLYLGALAFNANGTPGATTAGSGQVALGTVTQTAGAAATFSGKANLSSTAFAAYDGRYAKTAPAAMAKGYKVAPSVTANAWSAGTAGDAAGDAKITIPVKVLDSTVAKTAIDGASVTVAAKGMMFVVTAGGKTISGVDSLTFLADSALTSVDVYSHVTGEQSIVFTSGAATITQKITFQNYGSEVAAVALGTLPAQAQAGSTVSLSAVATDKWGNVVPGVQIAFSNTGAGYVQDVAVQTTDAKGAVAGRLIVLQNDLGTSYITATTTKAHTGLTADLASAKSVEFGLVDADVVAGGHRVFVNAEFAKGRTITVTIDGKRVYSKVQTTDNAVELAFTQKKAGAHTVTVRISGGIAFTEKVTTN